jgi:Niemann-Pick C1 protein
MKHARPPWSAVALALFALPLTLVAAADPEPDLTYKHEAGRCAIRGHCGKDGFFGPALPCPDNGLAEAPDEELRDALVDVCGEAWGEGDICCNGEQVSCWVYCHDEDEDEGMLTQWN